MKSNPKIISKNKKLNINKELDLDSEIKDILEEINNNENLQYSKININNENEYINQIYINKVKWLEWYKNSCAFDSFIAAFVFSLYPFIIKNDLFVNNEYFCDNINSSDDFKIYMEFINILIQNQNKDNSKFYFLYNDFVN